MLDIVIDARQAALSTGMDVRRILPFRNRRMVGPFIFMDHAGPVAVKPQDVASMDVLPHPHIGLSTVTYLFGGQVTHRDSLGIEMIIKPGEVNWMTAGRGIVHSERFEDPQLLAQGNLEMLQTWVALPEKYEEVSPSFENYKPDELPIHTDKGVWMRLVAGNAYGLKNNVSTLSPLFYIHVNLEKDTKFTMPKEHSERGLYIAKGSLEVKGNIYRKGQMLVFTKGADPTIVSKEHSTLILLGGEPLGERFIWWNFVSSHKERIEQAKADWKEGRFTLPPLDNNEFVPLPEDKSRPAGNPSPQALS